MKKQNKAMIHAIIMVLANFSGMGIALSRMEVRR